MWLGRSAILVCSEALAQNGNNLDDHQKSLENSCIRSDRCLWQARRYGVGMSSSFGRPLSGPHHSHIRHLRHQEHQNFIHQQLKQGYRRGTTNVHCLCSVGGSIRQGEAERLMVWILAECGCISCGQNAQIWSQGTVGTGCLELVNLE